MAVIEANIHKCKQLEDHMSKPFNMTVEIIENKLWVHDLFTPSTSKKYERKHESCYTVDIKYCPFCGVSL